MTRINTTVGTNVIIEWVKTTQQQIKTHAAWYDHISENESEAFLKDKIPYTYLLRSGEKEHSYFISFVEQNGSIKHQGFILEYSQKGWYFRNGITSGPEEVTKENIDDLIPLMMHCNPSECIQLHRTKPCC